MANENYPDKVQCPLVDGKEIPDYECLENCDVVEGNIDAQMPEEYTTKRNWKVICCGCKWHNVI